MLHTELFCKALVNNEDYYAVMRDGELAVVPFRKIKRKKEFIFAKSYLIRRDVVLDCKVVEFSNAFKLVKTIKVRDRVNKHTSECYIIQLSDGRFTFNSPDNELRFNTVKETVAYIKAQENQINENTFVVHTAPILQTEAICAWLH